MKFTSHSHALSRLLAIAGLAMLCQPGFAQDNTALAGGTTAPSTVYNGPYELGQSTRQWLAMQRDGTQAGRGMPILGEPATLSYQRYVDSYKYKIPETYQSAVSSGAGKSSK